MITVQWIDEMDLQLKWRTFVNERKAQSFSNKLATDPHVLNVEVLNN